jgi:uncharacterized protein YbcC (UPF0753/DUF2309 family)/NADH:ubiquinone oxidoreductase subunit 5 (subunit L)/multisubunit Na+/H+ antiporter MnhA subunit
VLLDFLPLAAPLMLLLAAAAAFVRADQRSYLVPALAEAAALATMLGALGALGLLLLLGPGTSPMIGFGGIGFSVRLDAVSVAMLVLVSFVGWIVVRYARTYLDGEACHGAFTGWLCAAIAAVLLLVQAGNLLQLTAAWIGVDLCLRRLLLFYPERVGAQRAARKHAVFSGLGAVALVAAAAALSIRYGTFDIAAINVATQAEGASGLTFAAAAFLAVAALFKSAQFPTHGWLTEVMEAPTPVSALLHAGVINAGGFLLIRFADVMVVAPGTLAVLAMVGGFTALFGALVMLTQPTVKTSLAWSTVAQMGFMTLQCGLALFPLALLHIVAHSLYKSHAFLASGGAVEQVAATRRPGPVAVPNGVAVARAFLAALALYAGMSVAFGALFGFDHKSPQAFALGTILIFGVAYLVAQGLADTAPRLLTRKAVRYSAAAAIGYFALHTVAEWLTAGTLPPAPTPGRLEWTLMAVAVLSFGLVAIAQALFPLWATHPAAAGLRIHLSNGLYINAALHRWLGGWSCVRHPAHPSAKPSSQPDITHAELPTPKTVLAAVDRAARAIPPLWPLASSVAVNPFLGQAGQSLAWASARLKRAAGVALTMPRAWYAERIRTGEITDDDLLKALRAAPPGLRPDSLVTLKQAAHSAQRIAIPLPTVAQLAAGVSGTDWPALISDRLGHWAAGYFDEGQALWAVTHGRGAYAAWRTFALHDLTPEIAGLQGFAATIADMPETADEAIAAAVERLGVRPKGLEHYFHRLLVRLGGWAQLGRYRLWQAELEGGTDATVKDLLAVQLAWEVALFAQYRPQIELPWSGAITDYCQPIAPTLDDGIDAILQEAAERAAQRQLCGLLSRSRSIAPGRRPALQAAFCIDVRSEIFRRALERVHPGIETLGVAGFFGLAIAHRRFASDVVEARLPALLTPMAATRPEQAAAQLAGVEHAARIEARAKRAWGRFKLAAISSFAFVEATGPLYIGKLLRDAFGLASTGMPGDPKPCFDDPLPDLAARISLAERALRAMSMTDGFARLVLLVGHGANVVNNPHASALHCGACGGYSGEVNARLLAALLNDDEVREGLCARGIRIPPDTLFLGALHDTTTDAITIYERDHTSPAHGQDLNQARSWLGAAGALACAERVRRLPRASGVQDVARRARDWAEVRPEWGLAGCQAFIAAPRRRTAGHDLQGRVFLHDYEWRRDEGFEMLELILTAPVVVASWISLQYYGSTVAPEVFGAGNKLLHNVTGGVGVVEGNGGLLRAGLPWQSVHDGQRLVHEPLRLTVVLEAPREAVSAILQRHAEVRVLFDHKWLHLLALDDERRMLWRYRGKLEWEAVTSADTEPVPAPAVA